MFRVVGVGERLTAGSPSAATVAEALQFFGEKGWTFCVHSLSPAENQMHVDALKVAAQTFDVAKLRWQLHHLNDMPANLLAELAALEGAGRHPGLALHVGQRRVALAHRASISG